MASQSTTPGTGFAQMSESRRKHTQKTGNRTQSKTANPANKATRTTKELIKK
jgi:hypothetical protein